MNRIAPTAVPLFVAPGPFGLLNRAIRCLSNFLPFKIITLLSETVMQRLGREMKEKLVDPTWSPKWSGNGKLAKTASGALPIGVTRFGHNFLPFNAKYDLRLQF